MQIIHSWRGLLRPEINRIRCTCPKIFSSNPVNSSSNSRSISNSILSHRLTSHIHSRTTNLLCPSTSSNYSSLPVDIIIFHKNRKRHSAITSHSSTAFLISTCTNQRSKHLFRRMHTVMSPLLQVLFSSSFGGANSQTIKSSTANPSNRLEVALCLVCSSSHHLSSSLVNNTDTNNNSNSHSRLHQTKQDHTNNKVQALSNLCFRIKTTDKATFLVQRARTISRNSNKSNQLLSKGMFMAPWQLNLPKPSRRPVKAV